LAALAGACQVLINLEEPQGLALGADAAPDPCEHRLPPSAPEPATDAGAARQLGLAAMRTFDFSGRPTEALPGFDLDGLCTCDKRPGAKDGLTCVRAASQDPLSVCDAPGGIDNAVGDLFKKYAKDYAAAGFDINDTIGVTSAISHGDYTLIFHLSDYNGELNDSYVGLGVINSIGLTGVKGIASDGGAEDPACMSRADAGRCRSDAGELEPCWNGCDKWRVLSEATIQSPIERGGLVPISHADAYVRDGILVARISNTSPFRLGPIPILLSDIRVVAELKLRDFSNRSVAFGSGEARRFELVNGLLVGRTLATNLIALLGELSNPVGGGLLCEPAGATLFEGVKEQVCARRDVPARPGAPSTAACDGLSVAFPFSAAAAYIEAAPSGFDAGVITGDCPGRLMKAKQDAAAFFSCND
jgi:hypothetical protein